MAEGGEGKDWGGVVRKGKGKLGRETIERSKPPILYCLIPYMALRTRPDTRLPQSRAGGQGL